MSRSRAIAIEDVLRSDTRLGDLLGVLRSLWSVLPGAPALVCILTLLTTVEVGLQVALAFSGKIALDSVLSGNSIGVLTLASSGFLLIAVLVIARARMVKMESASLQWREIAVQRLATNISTGSLQDLSSVPMAGLREIIMTDAPFLTRFGIETFSQSIVLAAWISAAFCFLAWFGAPLLGILFVVLALCTLLLGTGALRHLKLTSERFKRLADLSQSARDVVEVERVQLTRQFGLGSRFTDQFEQAHQAFRKIAFRQGRLTAGIRASVSIVNAVAFLGLVIAGGWMIKERNLEPGVLLAALFILGQMVGALLQMGDIAGRLAEAAAAGRRMGVYWQHDEPTIQSSLSPDEALPQDVVQLNTQSLAFGYSAGSQVFNAVDVRLERGRITALTAETGAGKSTFARTVCGLLAPDAGCVVVSTRHGEKSIDAMPAGSVLYLGANPIILPGSLTDNLLLRDASASIADLAIQDNPGFESIRAALRRDGQQLDWQSQQIDASGLGLSSGQAQLLQLCRALARDPAIVVFDEATSSLDMETERLVQQSLIDWCRQRICLVVSHRQCPWLDAADNRINW